MSVKNEFKPEYFIEKFRMNQENYNFKREDFLNELGKCLLEYCQTTTDGINPETDKLYYYRFREIVKEFEKLYWEISSRLSTPLTQRLWNAFFATQVVPIRKGWYPDIQERITELRDKTPVHNTKNPSNRKSHKNGKGNN